MYAKKISTFKKAGKEVFLLKCINDIDGLAIKGLL